MLHTLIELLPILYKVFFVFIVGVLAVMQSNGQGITLATDNANKSALLRKNTSPNDTVAIFKVDTALWKSGYIKMLKFDSTRNDGLPGSGAAMSWLSSTGVQKATPMTIMLYPGPIMSTTAASHSIDSLGTVINGKVNKVDSLTVYATPKQIGDSGFFKRAAFTAAAMIALFGYTPLQASDITGKVNYTDTAAMLASANSAIASNTTNFLNYYTKTLSDLRYLQSYTETDPFWHSDSSTYTKKTYVTAALSTYLTSAIAASTYQPIGSYLVAADITGKRNISDSTGNNGTTPLWRLNKSRDSVVALIPSLTGYVQTTRTFSTTSPITGGGDLSSNRTIAINNAAADNSTKGAASFDANYFDDNGSGIISFAVTSGTGTVSANAVTINQPRGKITLSSPSVLAAATLSITLTNSFITSTSTINVGVNGNGSNITLGINCYIKSQTSGSCVINILNLSLLSTFTSSVIIDYLIVN